MRLPVVISVIFLLFLAEYGGSTTKLQRLAGTTTGPVYYVDAQMGNDGNPGTQSAPWRTLAKANANAKAGVTIVLSGTFTKQVLFPSGAGTATARITYEAAPAGATLNQPGYVGTIPYEVYLDARPYVTVTGLTIENTAYRTAPVQDKGVVLRSTSHDTFTGNTFLWMQMQLIGSSFNTITNNTWHNYIGSYVNGQPQTSGNMLNLVLGSHDNLIDGNTMKNAGHSLIEIGNGTGNKERNANNTISNNALDNTWYKDIILSDNGQGTTVEDNQLLDANSVPTLYSTVPGQVGQLETSSAAVQFSGENFVLRRNTISNAVCTYGCVTLGSRWYTGVGAPAGGTLIESLNNRIYGNTFVGNHGAASVSFIEFLSSADISAGRTTVPALTRNRVYRNTFTGNSGTQYSWNGSTFYSTFIYHSATEAPPWVGENGNQVVSNRFDSANANLIDVTYGATTIHKVQTLAQFEALCVVPKVKDKRLAAAKHAIKRAHCSVGKVTKAFSARVKRERVISQKPRAGSQHPAGAKVRLKVRKRH